MDNSTDFEERYAKQTIDWLLRNLTESFAGGYHIDTHSVLRLRHELFLMIIANIRGHSHHQ